MGSHSFNLTEATARNKINISSPSLGHLELHGTSQYGGKGPSMWPVNQRIRVLDRPCSSPESGIFIEGTKPYAG